MKSTDCPSDTARPTHSIGTINEPGSTLASVTDTMTIQPATSDDLDLVASLTSETRRRLAEWAPIYFHPADGADELHAGFLAFILGSEDHTTQLLISGGETVGFFVEVAQSTHTWVDDLCVSDEAFWPAAVDAVIDSVDSPWATCVSTSDTARARALEAKGLQVISSYWARTTEGVAPSEPSSRELTDFDPANSARHTFGGQAFRPEVPGALVVAAVNGHAIGSPSATPPIYNPGGPTTVIDQVIGANRHEVLQLALAAAAGRGDAQVVVVCAADDKQLEEIVAGAGFGRVVDFTGSSIATAD